MESWIEVRDMSRVFLRMHAQFQVLLTRRIIVGLQLDRREVLPRDECPHGMLLSLVARA